MAAAPQVSATEVQIAYLAIKMAKDGREIEQVLERNLKSISGGNMTVLHLAAAEGDDWALEYIVDYIRTAGRSLDIENSFGRTPLESAIAAYSTECVVLLLDAGASPQRRNGRGEQPLHTAIKSAGPVHICSALLAHGADVNATIDSAHEYPRTPLDIALDMCNSSSLTNAEREELYVVVEMLLNYGAAVPTNHSERATFRNDYIIKWLMWESSRTCLNRGSKSWLRHYFRSESSPLCWYPLRRCPAHECGSFASFVFAHTDSDVAMTLIQNTDVRKHGTGLAYAIVSPCKQSRRLRSLGKLLDELLERLPSDKPFLDQSGDLLRHVTPQQ